MTQRIFDVDSSNDMCELWKILPSEVDKVELTDDGLTGFWYKDHFTTGVIKIKWGSKKEIYRISDKDNIINLLKDCLEILKTEIWESCILPNGREYNREYLIDEIEHVFENENL